MCEIRRFGRNDHDIVISDLAVRDRDLGARIVRAKTRHFRIDACGTDFYLKNVVE